MKYIYIAMNKSMPGVLKIGASSNPAVRVQGLANTSVPEPFYLAYASLIVNRRWTDVEQEVFAVLAEYRVTKREFFKCSLRDAIIAVVNATVGVPAKMSLLDPEDFDDPGMEFRENEFVSPSEYEAFEELVYTIRWNAEGRWIMAGEPNKKGGE